MPNTSIFADTKDGTVAFYRKDDDGKGYRVVSGSDILSLVKEMKEHSRCFREPYDPAAEIPDVFATVSPQVLKPVSQDELRAVRRGLGFR